MNETSKCYDLRKRRGDFTRYLRGKGIDVGAGRDCLRVPEGSVLAWDVAQGDAQELAGLPDAEFDFVYSSHCLEHLRDVGRALTNWARVLRPGGHLYVVVPDYTLYEKHRWPSVFNLDHRHSFSLHLTRQQVGRASHHHIWADLGPILAGLGTPIIEARLEDTGYDYNIGPHADQTCGPVLAQICFVARKLA